VATGPHNVSKIVSRSEDGSYNYSHGITFNLSPLEKAKFDLWQAGSGTFDETGLAEDEIMRFRSFKQDSRRFYELMSKYFVDLSVRSVGTDEFSFSFSLNTSDDSITALAHKAVEFYARNIFNSQLINERLMAIGEKTPDLFNVASDIMPNAVKQFRIVNYKGIRDSYVDNIPIDTKWIFITGENGFGKTSILQALAIGLYGERDGDRLLLDTDEKTLIDVPRIGVEFRSNNQTILNNVGVREFHKLKNLVCYGPSRLLVQSNQTKNEIAANSSTTFSLFSPNGVLLNIEYNLLIWKLQGDDRFEKVKSIFTRLIPFLHDIEINQERVYYIEKEPSEDIGPNTNTYSPTTFEDLASGARGIIAMVGDLIIRLFEGQPSISDPRELHGIALIDELDLHWHPKLQRELPHTLSSMFPNIQFIATTHSVIPFLGAPKNSVFLKVTRTIDYGIQIDRLNLDIKNLLPNILLTSSLFDMDKISQINNEGVSNIRTEDSEAEMERNIRRERYLKEFEQNNRDFPSNLFNQDDL